MSKIEYTSWPIGQVPKHLQRPELDQVKELGYDWDDPRDVIDMFEEKVAKMDKTIPVYVYCASGGRSGLTKELMMKENFKEVYNLSIGYEGWVAK